MHRLSASLFDRVHASNGGGVARFSEDWLHYIVV